MDPIQHLLVQEACRRLVLQAAARADAGDASGLAALFIADGVLVRPNTEPLHGRNAICVAYTSRPANRITRHFISNTLVDVRSPEQAHALSYVTLWAGSIDDPSGPRGRPAQAPQVVGEFEDLLSLTSEGWRIARREARFLLFTT